MVQKTITARRKASRRGSMLNNVETLEPRRLLSTTNPLEWATGAPYVDEGSPYALTLPATVNGSPASTFSVSWGDGGWERYPGGGVVTHVYADGRSANDRRPIEVLHSGDVPVVTGVGSGKATAFGDTRFAQSDRFTSMPGAIHRLSSLASLVAVDETRGHVYVAGVTHGRLEVVRYDAAGVQDATFGTNGVAAVPVTSSTRPLRLVALPDGGTLLAAQTIQRDVPAWLIARFDSAGRPVTSFGDNGVSRQADYASAVTPSFFLRWNAAAVQSDGKTVLVGRGPGTGSGAGFVVTRINANGSPDTAFGTNGVVAIDADAGGESADAVTIDENGKIVVAGTAYRLTGGTSGSFAAGGVVIKRLNADGSSDPTFANGGHVYHATSNPNSHYVGDVLARGGKVYVAGNFLSNHSPESAKDLFIAAYTATGGRDLTFGDGSWTNEATMNVGAYGSVARLTIEPDGALIVAGRAGQWVDGRIHESTVLWRTDRLGVTRTEFGPDGLARPAVPWSGVYATDATLLADGTLLLAEGAAGAANVSFVRRFLPQGAVIVRNVAPTGRVTVSGGPFVAGGTNRPTVSIVDVTDPSPIDTAAGFTYAFEVDNDGRWDVSGSASSLLLPSSVVATAGTKTVRAAVSDKDGGQSVYTVTWVVAAAPNNPTPPPTTVGGTIRGVLFDDANANGVRNAGEAVLAGRTVWLDLTDDKVVASNEPTVITDANGAYAFTGLAAREYKVRQVLPGGWSQTTPANGFGHRVPVGTNATVLGRDFGSRRITVTPPPPPPPPTASGRISGSIFEDKNGNGRRDSGEGLLSGRTVWIDLNNDKRIDANEARTLTDSSGNWTFSNLPAGTYKVRQVLPSGWTQTTPANGYGINVTLSSSSSTVSGRLFGARR